MPKTLLIGPAGCGKTHRLFDEFCEALAGAPDPLREDLFFIVPSAEHTERVVSLLIQRGLKGFFHKRVTTLSRLADGLFRVVDIPVVSGLTRQKIVRDLFRENAWEYFCEAREQPGFTALASQFVTELKESCVSSGEFRERMNKLKGFEPAYAAKYEALADFYEKYEAQLKIRGLRDNQDALRIFRERKKRTAPPAVRFRSIWIDGFFDFSNLQREYLRELFAITERITITLTKEDGGDPEDAFEPVNRTQRDLVALGFQEQWMKSRSYRTGSPALTFLQQNLFKGGSAKRATPLLKKKKGSSLAQDIVLLDAIGTEGEIELIAREVHKHYATGNYRYSDFAVLFRQIRHYAPVIAEVFARYGIPAEIHERDRLKFSAWINAAASILVLFRDGWKREDLFGFLKSGYTRRFGSEGAKDEAWIAAFEQRAYLEGVTETREAWLADWQREGAGELPAFNEKKKNLLQVFADIEDRFRAAKTAEEHIRTFKHAAYETFGILDVSDRYTAFTRRDAACVQRFEALLDEIRDYSRNAPAGEVTFENFAEHFLGLVEMDVYSLHERDKNRVQIYDISLARQKEYKIVFVAGLLEKVFPMQVREDPLLSDWERKLMEGEGGHSLAEHLPRQNIERYFFYLAVTRARERLYLSCPHLDFEGKEYLPSFYLDEVKNLFAGKLPVIGQVLSRPFPNAEDAVTQREREIAVLAGFRDKEDARHEAMPELSGDPSSRERIVAALEPVRDGISDEKILSGGYFRIKKTSPTSLETHAKCPFRYFSDKILRLQDTGGDISLMQKGNILHLVLRRYFDPEVKRDPSLSLEQFIEQGIEEGLKQYPIAWTATYREALDRRELFEMLFDFLVLETGRLENSSFRPFRVEYAFGGSGPDEPPPFMIEGDGASVALKGRADRIDTDPERKSAIVIDYKRSAKFENAHLALGTALQLPLYLLAVQQHLGLRPLAAEIYSVRDRKRSGFYCEELIRLFDKEYRGRSGLEDPVFRKILDRARVFALKFARSIEAARISARPRACESFCPYDTVCRIEKWRLPLILEEIREEDRNDPALAPFQTDREED